MSCTANRMLDVFVCLFFVCCFLIRIIAFVCRKRCGVGGDYHSVTRQRPLCVSVCHYPQCPPVCRVDLSSPQAGERTAWDDIHRASHKRSEVSTSFNDLCNTTL